MSDKFFNKLYKTSTKKDLLEILTGNVYDLNRILNSDGFSYYKIKEYQDYTPLVKTISFSDTLDRRGVDKAIKLFKTIGSSLVGIKAVHKVKTLHVRQYFTVEHTRDNRFCVSAQLGFELEQGDVVYPDCIDNKIEIVNER